MLDLLERLRHPLASERFAAAAALDDLPQTAEIEQALLAACRDVDAKVRRAAMHSLSCGHCKPDGCIGPSAVDVLVAGLLGDPSIRNRRWCAGMLMHGQAGRGAAITAAFEAVLRTADDRVLRDRAASFLAGGRDQRPHAEWFADWQARRAELLAS